MTTQLQLINIIIIMVLTLIPIKFIIRSLKKISGEISLKHLEFEANSWSLTGIFIK